MRFYYTFKIIHFIIHAKYTCMNYACSCFWLMGYMAYTSADDVENPEGNIRSGSRNHSNINS